MQWRARVVAPIIAAVLGTTGGVTTALMLDDPSAPQNDPLGFGAPLLNQACTGKAILVVGYGDSSAPLGNGIAENKPGVKYLETAHSCATQLYPENRKSPPKYVAYTGPFASRVAPCTLRMTGDHRTDFVAMLRAGNTELVKCPCELNTAQVAPALFLGMEPTDDQLVWIRSLQGMLHDYDPDNFKSSMITGTFDEPTRREVLSQQVKAGYLGHNGTVDTETWRILTDRICKIYTY